MDTNTGQFFEKTPPQSNGINTCTLGARTYKLHIITLPSTTGNEAEISCLLDPDLIPFLPNPLPFANRPNDNPNFCVRQTVHKGAGMFAVRDIPAGELIVAEHPALILPSGKFPAEVYNELGNRLSKERRAVLLSLSNSRPKEECESPVEGIVRTNALVLELDPKEEISEDKREIYGGVYPFINRANHSCGPNAAVKWDLASLTESLYALRPIAAGEEIHKPYINPALPRETRISILQKNYRFTCDCPWCNIRQSLDPRVKQSDFTLDELTQIATSDANRAQLGTWIFTHPGYKKWSTDLARTDDVVISSHIEALALIEKEGMQGLQNLFIEEIAMCYSMLGDIGAFREWGKRVVTLNQVEDPALARKFEEWLVDPEKGIKKWAWRKRQREYMPGRRKLKAGHDVEFVDGVDAFQLLFQFPD
ncbi:hypothetical protein GALMADRAFT_257170 [Galerina marginata CBS 339.88]|uniref:SET domain-containing protein n=1 Tax=Galerina marginata (strain CBS 339.88) TaxID=685588 RepID=A0A067SEQ7_GALM3|nr:hypothetical protein GALMADRAFT_257170 [Galerina marginata CBS 339.88]